MSSSSKLELVVALMLGASCGPGDYFAIPESDLRPALDSYFAAVMDSRPMPGLAAAVVKDGRVIYAKGFGLRTLGGPDPVTPETVFHTASVSKAFVGVVLLSNYDGQSSFELVEVADGVFDVGLGRTPALPQASIAIPVARVLAVEGMDAAIAEYRRLRQVDDPRYRVGMSDLITLGHDLRQTGRLDEAIRFYQLNAEEQPDYFASHLALAQAFLMKGDTSRAVESYRTMLSLDPERFGCPESCYRDDRLQALLPNR